MIQLQRYILIAILFIGGSSFECSDKPITPPEINAFAYSPAIPVLKDLSVNPVLRVAISIPAGNIEQQYTHLRCNLNERAVSTIQKIDVYLTGAEGFSTEHLLVSYGPESTSFDIPVTINLKAGVWFVWFSVLLKSDANIDEMIELHCTELVHVDGKSKIVQQGNSDYTKRTGLVLRKRFDNGGDTYRIPGLVATDKGTLIAVYDKRISNADLPSDIDVAMSRSTDHGNTWEPMKIIMDMGPPHNQNGIGDPAVLFDPVTKKIFVAALWSKGNRSIAGSLPGLSPDSTGQFMLVHSNDDGNTWSTPYSITAQVKNPAWHILFNGPGMGIAMKNGTLVFAAQYWNEKKVPYSTLIYSNDHGAVWKGKLLGPKSNTTESQIVETTPGTLMLNMRDNRGSFRSVATTTDMGTSWTEHGTSYSALPDPVCMGSIIKASVMVNGVKKEVLFFSNPNTPSGRFNITVKASLDMGETWLPANQLLIDERPCYGYSCLVKIDDNTLGLLYEGTKELYFVKIPVNHILKP